MRASIAVAPEDGDLAVAEIARVADYPGFVQIMVFARTSEPLGRRKCWNIHEAATRHNLPVAIHVGGRGGGPITEAGWPSYYFEHHVGLAIDCQAQVIILVCEGVFGRFPSLKFVLIEPGFAWFPALMWATRSKLANSERRDSTPEISAIRTDPRALLDHDPADRSASEAGIFPPTA